MQRLSNLPLSDLEQLAYCDPEDPTAPPPELIRAAQAEIDRRDSVKFSRHFHLPSVPERINGIRI